MWTTTSIVASLVLCTKLVRAVNDWSVPCISGVCSYDLPDAQEISSGTLEIWGSAISDITPAAGWEILGCDQNAMEQDIRLVCTSSAPACDHLYSGGGAEGKIVRLPESCGKSAFARVARAWVPRDQSMPASSATHLTRVKRTQSEVKALRLDTDFHAINPNQKGTVEFGIRALTVPYTFNRSSNVPINVTNLEAVFKQSIGCTPPTFGVEVDMNVTVHARIPITVIVSGTLLPPKIKDFAISSTGLSVDVNGSLTFQADVQATLDSGQVTIFEVGIPGLDFPGIFSLGPTFQINTQAIASFDLAVVAQVGINYHLDNLQFTYPPRSPRDTPNVKNFGLPHTHFELSATPFVQATGSIEGHLIPTLNLGVSVFKKVKAGISVALDSSAVLNIKLEPVDRMHNSSGLNEAHDTEFEKGKIALDHEADSDVADRSSVASSLVGKDSALDQPFNGCFEADVGLDFNVAADADFLNIMDANTTLTIFEDTIRVYKKCFGKNADADARAVPSIPASQHEKRSLQIGAAESANANPKRTHLQCLNSTFTGMVQVANQVISLSGHK